jgi:hypothetical protein
MRRDFIKALESMDSIVGFARQLRRWLSNPSEAFR